MKLLLEIRDEDIGQTAKKIPLKKREAARAILLRGSKIALLNVSRNNYYKLPGGGVESGETIEEALFREMIEETGCKIKIISEVGKIIEHRTRVGAVQTSYCYVARAVEVGTPHFDKGELRAGYKLEWVGIDKALKLLKKQPETWDRKEMYLGKFIIKRDLAFLKEALHKKQ